MARRRIVIKRRDTGAVFPVAARKLAAAIVAEATTCFVPMTKLEAAEWFARRHPKCPKCNRHLPPHDCRWV